MPPSPARRAVARPWRPRAWRCRRRRWPASPTIPLHTFPSWIRGL